jgi:hypothetical protein
MNGFDEIAAETIQRSDDGTLLFFPRGSIGRGFVVPSDARRREIELSMAQFLRVTFWATFAGLLVGGSLGFMFPTILILEAVILIGFERRRAQLVEGLTESPLRYSRKRARESFAAHRSTAWLIALTALTSAMTFAAIYAIELHPQRGLALIPGVVILGGMASLWGRMVKSKLTPRPIHVITD